MYWWTAKPSPIPVYLNIIFAYETSLWIIFFTTILATTITWIFILRPRSHKITKFDLLFAIYTILIQHPHPKPASLPSRCVTLLWIFSTMILAVSFNGISFTLLTKEIYNYELRTIEDASAAPDTRFCYEPINARILFPTIPKSVAKALEQKRYNISPIPLCLKLASEQEHIFAVAAARPTKYIFLEHAETGIGGLHSLKDKFLRYDIQMAMRSGYPLLKRFNFWIPRIVESGFFVRWESDFNFYTMRKDRSSTKSTIDKLGLQHLLIAFIIFIGGMAMAIIAFFFENFKLFNRCN